MAFTSKQVQALRRRLDSGKIRTRQEHGRELSYIEAWHAIAEANRIFGYEGWSRETIESRCILARDVRGTFTAIYVARVRITVVADSHTVVREGHGTGEGRGQSPGDCHDVAVKAAETDATKRALATFGSPFGLMLYLGNGSSQRAPRRTPPTPPPTQPTPVVKAEDKPAVQSPEIPVTSAVLAPALANDTPALAISYPKRHRDKAHLRFVGSQSCLICGRQPSDAHHLRFAQARALSMKVSDEFTVPLCRVHHRQAHETSNEQVWWSTFKIDPLSVAKSLWTESRVKQEPAFE
jgi:hypothetical protein